MFAVRGIQKCFFRKLGWFLAAKKRGSTVCGRTHSWMMAQELALGIWCEQLVKTWEPGNKFNFYVSLRLLQLRDALYLCLLSTGHPRRVIKKVMEPCC